MPTRLLKLQAPKSCDTNTAILYGSLPVKFAKLSRRQIHHLGCIVRRIYYHRCASVFTHCLADLDTNSGLSTDVTMKDQASDDSEELGLVYPDDFYLDDSRDLS